MKLLPLSSRPVDRKNLTRATLTLVIAAGGFVLPARARTVGSGHLATQARNVSGFHAVALESDADVIVTQGGTEGLTVEAEDNILPLIRTEVDSKGVLHLGYKPNESVTTTKKTTFKLSAKLLDDLVLAGSGNIRAGSLTMPGGGKFSVALPGSGNVSVSKLSAGSVRASVEGSGDIQLAGEANEQAVSIDGSGKYLAGNLKTRTATVEVDGSGDTKVSARDNLKIEINGSGSVGYYGNPRVKKSINGSGDIKALGGQGR